MAFSRARILPGSVEKNVEYWQLCAEILPHKRCSESYRTLVFPYLIDSKWLTSRPAFGPQPVPVVTLQTRKECFPQKTLQPDDRLLRRHCTPGSVSLYCCTLRNTTGILEGIRQEALMEGSDPSGGGPTAGAFAGFSAGFGTWNPISNVRSSSRWSPLIVPE